MLKFLSNILKQAFPDKFLSLEFFNIALVIIKKTIPVTSVSSTYLSNYFLKLTKQDFHILLINLACFLRL